MVRVKSLLKNRKYRLILLLSVMTALSAALTGQILIARDLKPGIRIMPLGDSITQGAAKRDSYRRPLWKMLAEAGFEVNFVGSMKKHWPYNKPPHTDFDMNHEGHWGWRTDEVLTLISRWAKKARPDVVLIHLGSNDVFQRQNNEQTVEELRKIIIALRQHNPGVQVLLAQIIPAKGKAARAEIEKLNQLLPDMAQSLSTAESPVRIVNLNSGFDPRTDTYDGVHPNDSGIRKMAHGWYRALVPILPVPEE
jgi:predicted TIM-barrel fold metal-dependent hydrolase